MKKKKKKNRRLRARYRKDATRIEVVMDEYDDNHPYPRWKIIVYGDKLLVCKLTKQERHGWQVDYLLEDCGTYTWTELNRLAYKELEKVVEEEGGSSVGVEFEHPGELCQHFMDQIQENKMEAVLINGEEYQFDTEKTTRIMKTIVKCANQKKRVNISYKKGDSKVVRRDIAPYSMKDNYLYVTDTRDGNEKIKSLKIYNIISAKKCVRSFKPKWDIEL